MMTRTPFHHFVTLGPHDMYQSPEGFRIQNYSGVNIEVEVRGIEPRKPWWETLAEGYNYDQRGEILCCSDC